MRIRIHSLARVAARLALFVPLALALAWPTLLGALCSLFALRRTTRMDLVG